MTNRILVPMTHSTESEKALAHALSNFPDAEITVLHVINPSYHYGAEGYFSYEQIMEGEERKAEQLFETAREIAETHDVTITTERLVGHTSRTIVEYAEENRFDQVIMGSRGRSGISRILLGSVAEAVARRSPVPVTIVR